MTILKCEGWMLFSVEVLKNVPDMLNCFFFRSPCAKKSGRNSVLLRFRLTFAFDESKVFYFGCICGMYGMCRGA